jgi:hypothetical protein
MKKRMRVQIYFSDSEREFYDDLVRVAKLTGMSMSYIASSAYSWGFYEMLNTGVFDLPAFRSKQLSKSSKVSAKKSRKVKP